MTGPQAAPVSTGPAGFARHDEYAAQRCACKHLVYADDTEGGPCRFCDCTNHRHPEAATA